jgi:hypothetical protein
VSSIEAANPRVFRGFLFVGHFGKSDKDTMAQMAGFGDDAGAEFSNKFAEPTRRVVAKTVTSCSISAVL